MMEILVTISILTILIGIAVPAYTAFIGSRRVRSCTEDLVSYVRIASSEALKRNNTFYLSFSGGSNWCYGLSNTGACDCTASNSCEVDNIEVVVRSSNYTGQSTTLSTTGFSGGSIVFQGNLGTVTASGTASFSVAGISATVMVNNRGLASVCSNSLSGYYAACP